MIDVPSRRAAIACPLFVDDTSTRWPLYVQVMSEASGVLWESLCVRTSLATALYGHVRIRRIGIDPRPTPQGSLFH